MVLELKVENQTIINDVNFEYSINMNELNRAVISIDGNTNFQRNLLSIGSTISILRNGVTDFIGKINSISNLAGNGIKIIVRGEEEEYVKNNNTLSTVGTNGVWKNTLSKTIFTEILDQGINYSAGTIDDGVLVDNKVSESESIWNSFTNLLTKVGQEKIINYDDKTVDVRDSIGDEEITEVVDTTVDDFNRADSTTVGNNWAETENVSTDFQIISSKLLISDNTDTSSPDDIAITKTFNYSLNLKDLLGNYIEIDFWKEVADDFGYIYINFPDNNNTIITGIQDSGRLKFLVFPDGSARIYLTDNLNNLISYTDYSNVFSSTQGTLKLENIGINSVRLTFPDGTTDTINSTYLNNLNYIRFRRNGSTSTTIGDVYSDNIKTHQTITYTNTKIFNEGTDFDYLFFQESEPKAKKVIIYGKGDGENQITATATDSGFTQGEDNILTINDPTIISVSEAQIRADSELSRVKDNVEVYTIPIRNPQKEYLLGDTLEINAPSYGLTNKEVRIMRVIRGRKGKDETLSVEVCNAAYSRTFKNTQQKIAQTTLETRNKDTFMQGSGNTLNYGGQINGNDTHPLIIPINLPDTFIRDEADNLRVNSFTFDYDIDKFRQTAGGIGASGVDADVNGNSGEDDPACENSTGLNTASIDFDYDNKFQSGGGSTYLEIVLPFLTGDTDFTIFHFYLVADKPTFVTTNGYGIEVKNIDTGSTYFLDTVCEDGNMFSISIIITGDIEGDTIRMSITDYIGTEDYTFGISGSEIAEHTHTAGTLNAELHPHNSGSYEVNDTEIANAITIGDDVADSSSVDSTGISWALEFWDGSAWVSKNSGSETFPSGQTFNKGLDLSSGGTYPDNSGDWQLKIYTDNTSPDLIKGIVNVKHNLDI